MIVTRLFWLLSWMLLEYISYYSTTDAVCSPISMDRVKLAAVSARIAFKENSAKEGKRFAAYHYQINWLLMKKLFDYEITAFVASHKNDTIISFGSNIRVDQLRKEMKKVKKDRMQVGRREDNIKISTFLMKAFKKLEQDTILPGGFQRDRTYLITGHGLGGALASIFALSMVNKLVDGKHMWSSNANQLITFGEPRVGNRNFAIFHDKYLSSDQKLRFVHDNDILPEIPTTKRLYLHHSRKVFIETVGKRHIIKVCGVGDVPSHCGNRKPKSEEANDIQRYEKILFDSKNHDYYDRKGEERSSFTDTQCLLPKEDVNLKKKKKKKKVTANSSKLNRV